MKQTTGHAGASPRFFFQWGDIGEYHWGLERKKTHYAELSIIVHNYSLYHFNVVAGATHYTICS